jgi:hypothetical protein
MLDENTIVTDLAVAQTRTTRDLSILAIIEAEHKVARFHRATISDASLASRGVGCHRD